MAPLAELLRPRTLDEIVGQDQLVGTDGPLRRFVDSRQLTSMILWGPAGTGKTTLARIVAHAAGYVMEPLSAVSSGVKDVREAIARARERLGQHGQRTVLFIDEVHRFNKAQQDLLLPATETGEVVLIGATTENPYFEVNAALMSRSTLWRLRPLGDDDLAILVRRGLELRAATISDEAKEAIVASADGDARSALTTLDTAIVLARLDDHSARVELSHVARARDGRLYHQSADTHYDQISAFIKSVRGSDPDAAMYWLLTLLESGESARFIARRLVILASEDIGLADPLGLLVAEAAARAVEFVGLPEARLTLSHATLTLALYAQEQLRYPRTGRRDGRRAVGGTGGGSRTPARRVVSQRRSPRSRQRVSLRARLSRGVGRPAVPARSFCRGHVLRPVGVRQRGLTRRAVARANEPLPPGQTRLASRVTRVEAAQLRSIFLDYFASKGHTVVPSASLIPHDPTLLFTVAGMVPFKPYFSGEETPPYARAVSVQKCFRASDIENIGVTQRHLTFFEMLGNFSFGDYFKEGAISFAWQLITEGFGMDPDRLWVTVHISDDEAADLWRDLIGIRPERIQRLDEDNFWTMGEVGPCGPSSEIFFDKGAKFGAEGGPAFGGDDRFVEFWNLVFTQYERAAGGTLSELPKKNIDTGAGFDRTLAILNGVDSVFATDFFAPLIETASRVLRTPYGQNEATDIAIRRVADHGRAMTMLVSDGVLPSNEGRGYVLRRIIRRAVLAARRAGSERSLTAPLVDATIEKMGAVYPALVNDRDLIIEVLEREEAGFARTLRTGLSLLEDEQRQVLAVDRRSFPVTWPSNCTTPTGSPSS